MAKINKISKKINRFSINIILFIISLISLYPIYWMAVATFSNEKEIFSYPPKFFPTSPTFENIIAVFKGNPFMRNLLNSFTVSLSFVILSLFLCSIAAYAFAKFDFPFKKVLFILILTTYAIPFSIQFIPLFIFLVKINWQNSLQALFVPWIANAFAIFWLRQNMLNIPDEILDAARIDGCSEFKIYFRIVLPNIKPALSSIGIILFILMFNDFLWPLIIIDSPEMATLPLMIMTIQAKLKYLLSWGELIAGSFLVTLPLIIVFIVLQRYLIRGIAGGAVKE